jgi:diguanylate cyclase (GGDEF)-like protein/PAS domain S-box-containing protein
VSEPSTILIVDDDDGIRDLLQLRLSNEGYTCLGADRPEEALDLIRSNNVALAVVDVKMPGMDGIELTKHIKKIEPDTCVLVITGYPDMDYAVDAMRSGAEDYLAKPFNLEEVSLSVQRSLQKRDLIMQNREYQRELEQKIHEKTAELEGTNKELRETKEYLENLIESSVDGIITTDREGRITFASQGAQEMLGYRSGEELLGRFAHEFYVGGNREAREVMGILRASGRLQNHETEFIRKDGETLAVSLSVSLLRSRDGEIIGTLGIGKDITEQKKLERDLRELSIKDSLTGLHNQRYFYERLEVEIERAKRQNHPLSLLLFDIDQFKSYNDKHGHLAGDGVLEKVGDIVRECTREHVDTGYRYGGDEFTVILSETTEDQAMSIAERLRKTFEARSFDGLTLSIGLMVYDLQFTSRTFIKKADEAMYGSKRSGGNQVYLLAAE